MAAGKPTKLDMTERLVRNPELTAKALAAGKSGIADALEVFLARPVSRKIRMSKAAARHVLIPVFIVAQHVQSAKPDERVKLGKQLTVVLRPLDVLLDILGNENSVSSSDSGSGSSSGNGSTEDPCRLEQDALDQARQNSLDAYQRFGDCLDDSADDSEESGGEQFDLGTGWDDLGGIGSSQSPDGDTQAPSVPDRPCTEEWEAYMALADDYTAAVDALSACRTANAGR
jgi:hypothetical protein